MSAVNVPEGRHPGVKELASWFDFDHLRYGIVRDTSAQFASLADALIATLPDDAELTAGLRKLLEAKDCAVRVAVKAQRARDAELEREPDEQA